MEKTPLQLRELTEELRAFNERLVLSNLREQEASAAAQHDRAMLEALLATLHEGVAILRGSRRIVMLNVAARQLMGIGQDEETSFDDLSRLDLRRLDMTHLPEAERPLLRALRGEAFVDAEMLLVLAAGDVRRVTASSTCTRVDGEVALAIVVFRDLTERHRLKAHLAQTARLAAVGTLAAGVAHEINNPLTSVRANIELIGDWLRREAAALSPVALVGLESMLADALSGSDRIATIVSGLVTFAGEAKERRAVIALHVVLDRSIALSANEHRHRARLSKVYGPAPLVEVDEARICQVLVNLLIHAAHRLPEGDAGRGEIEVTASTGSDGRAVITIRDNGPPIAQEALPHVFDPFFVTNATGPDLGLSLCRNLVLAMGGEIDVDSRPATGTTFRIRLPASTAPQERTPPAAFVAPAVGVRKASVLVVDDEPLIGVLLRRILSGDDVTVVETVEEALALLAARRTFDVIFSDLMMPGRSGIDLHDELARSSPQHLERLIIITGGAFTPAGVAFLERVPNQRIQKPFDAKAIRAAVRSLARGDSR